MERLKPISRLRRIGLAAGSGLLAVSALSGCSANAPINGDPTLKPPVETIDTKSVDDVILNEAKKLNIQVTETERARETRLWSRNPDSYPFDPTTSGSFDLEQGARETIIRVASTAILMGKSLNDDFRTTQDDLGNLVDSGNLYILAKLDETGSSFALDQGFDENGQFRAILYMDITFALDGSDSLIMAAQLTNIAERIRQGSEIASNIPSNLSPDEKNSAFAQVFLSSDIEADAYAAEAQAYIKQVGILGHAYDIPPSDMRERAIGYIKAGSNSQSQEWKDYLTDFLTPSDPIQDPQVS